MTSTNRREATARAASARTTTEKKRFLICWAKREIKGHFRINDINQLSNGILF